VTFAVRTDPEAIRAVLREVVAADPVRGTVLATIAASLEDGAWLATDGPRLAVRSSTQYEVLLAGQWSAQATAELVPLLRSLPDLTGLNGLPETVEALVAPLGAHVSRSMAECLFRLDELTEPVGVPGCTRVASVDDRATVQDWFAAFADAARVSRAKPGMVDRALDTGGCHLWLDPAGVPVSLAYRRPAAAGSARISTVYTPRQFRGHGYGSAVTAVATAAILAEGAVPVLFTDLANPTSNKIYRALGYRPVERRLIVSFG
jgi:GNAT superfamily N-acetyltransferase